MSTYVKAFNENRDGFNNEYKFSSSYSVRSEGDYQPPNYDSTSSSEDYYPTVPNPYYPPPGYNQKSRIAAALLAFRAGCLGIHNFYLEKRARAIVQLIMSLIIITLPISIIWGLVEGILLIIGNTN